MRPLSICTGVAFVLVVAAGCQPKNQDVGMPNGAPPTGYPAYPPGQVPPQGYPPAGYPPGQTPPPGVATAPTGMPGMPPATTPVPAGSGQMAVPGPLALQCKDDVPCITHRCNVQYGKCAIPCQSNVDCLSPTPACPGSASRPCWAPRTEEPEAPSARSCG